MRALAVLVAVVAALLAAAPARADLPVDWTILAMARAGLGDTPPGANDWSCRPTATRPNPVVLVHGTFALGANNWGAISPFLKNNGFCVFSFTYGQDPRYARFFYNPGGIRPLEESAAVLGAFVDRVLKETGAAKVDIVGHSQGSLMPTYWIKRLGGAPKVGRYVGMTPLWQGTNVALAGTLYALGARYPGGRELFIGLVRGWCGACPELIAGSDFLRDLGNPRVEGIDYTMVITRYDELVRPYTSGIMPGANNVIVQDVCRLDFAEHLGLVLDPTAGQVVRNALLPSAERRPVTCGVTTALGAPLGGPSR